MQTLAQHVERHGPLPVRDAIGWVLRAALAVWEIHRTGEPHGNIHAEAIFVDGEDCRGAGLLLSASQVEQDPLYHSIARTDGMGPTRRDDLWGLAVTLYFTLTGKMPFPKGIAAAIEGGRFRAPPPLAVVRSDLDVMQPLLDRFLRVDDPEIATAVEQLVYAIQDFSPTIADLQPLPLGADEGDAETSSPRPPEGVTTAPSTKARAQPGSRRVDGRSRLAMGLVGCGVLFVVLSIYANSQRGSEADPSPPGLTSAATTTTPIASTSPTPGEGAPTPAPSGVPPSGGLGAASAEPLSPPVVGAAEDLVACMTAMFPADAFAERKRAADFPCRERDAGELRKIITAALVRGGGGKATQAAREWTRLGWYQLAAIAMARANCCSSTAPIQTSPLLDVCDIEDALDGLGTTIRSGHDQQVADALDAYRVAIHCAVTAGGGGFFGQDEPPTTDQAAVFLRMVRRVRARRAE